MYVKFLLTSRRNPVTQSGLTKDPRKAPQLTPADLEKMSPKEKEQRVEAIRTTRLQQLAGPIAEALLAAMREGVELEGEPKKMVPIEDIAVQVIGADDTFIMPPHLREKLVEKGGTGSCVFVLRSREVLSRELATYRLPQDAEIELPGRNRKEKRMARQNLVRYPFSDHAKSMSNRHQFPGVYYVIVHSGAGATTYFFPFRENEMQEAVDEEKQKAVADGAGPGDSAPA